MTKKTGTAEWRDLDGNPVGDFMGWSQQSVLLAKVIAFLEKRASDLLKLAKNDLPKDVSDRLATAGVEIRACADALRNGTWEGK